MYKKKNQFSPENLRSTDYTFTSQQHASQGFTNGNEGKNVIKIQSNFENLGKQQFKKLSQNI